ncbi:hypothetical protein H6F43_04805 [Leptolyngbya sp. FACHB-36]|nr:hypothetical protein [Leptolyngbya sp. FACHB-36]
MHFIAVPFFLVLQVSHSLAAAILALRGKFYRFPLTIRLLNPSKSE